MRIVQGLLRNWAIIFFWKMWSHKCSCVHTNWETRVECKYNILKAFYIYKFRKRYKNCCSGDPWASCLFRGFFGEGGGGLISLLLEEESYFHFKIKHWDILKQKHFPSFFSNTKFKCTFFMFLSGKYYLLTLTNW